MRAKSQWKVKINRSVYVIRSTDLEASLTSLKRFTRALIPDRFYALSNFERKLKGAHIIAWSKTEAPSFKRSSLKNYFYL
jgi:hypothetical protein